MKALLWKNNKFEYNEKFPQCEPVEGEALIRVLLAGICNTDLEIIRGYMGFSGVLGHEFVGEVVKCANPEMLGKRVAGEINCGCGNCSYCKKNLGRHCLNRTVLGILGRDGAFAQYLTLPEKNLHIVPDNVSNQDAVFCEPVAAACEILEQVGILPDDEVLILGDGKLGILIAQVINTRKCKLLVAGKHPEKLKILEQLEINSLLIDRLGNRKFDLVIDATGSPSGLNEAIKYTRPRGKIILKTTVAEKQPLNMAAIVINELTIIGSRCGPFEPALKLLAGGQLKLKPLISGVYPLNQAEAAFKKAQEPGVFKILLDIEKNRY